LFNDWKDLSAICASTLALHVHERDLIYSCTPKGNFERNWETLRLL